MPSNPAHYFTKQQAETLAAQNAADDSDWHYVAEPVSNSPYNLYTVTIYAEDKEEKLGFL
jgi:hypothetical protein